VTAVSGTVTSTSSRPAYFMQKNSRGEQVASQLHEMLTRWGFTTVFDIASVLQNTTLIRRRIENGEVNGPRILTVGDPFWVKGGTPFTSEDFSKQITSTFRSRINCAGN